MRFRYKSDSNETEGAVVIARRSVTCNLTLDYFDTFFLLTTRSSTQEKVFSHRGISKHFGEVDLHYEVYSKANTYGKCLKIH
jgi:hypothetical protein